MLMTCTDAIPSIQPSWLPGMSNFSSFLPCQKNVTSFQLGELGEHSMVQDPTFTTRPSLLQLLPASRWGRECRHYSCISPARQALYCWRTQYWLPAASTQCHTHGIDRGGGLGKAKISGSDHLTLHRAPLQQIPRSRGSKSEPREAAQEEGDGRAAAGTGFQGNYKAQQPTELMLLMHADKVLSEPSITGKQAHDMTLHECNAVDSTG